MPAKDILVYVFLRGGCDALNFVAPLDGEDRKIYEEERPSLKINNSGADGLLKLDARFGFHPSASNLHALYDAKKLAVIHAAGIPCNNRSHFDAQNIVELGIADKKVMSTGWLTRHLECVGVPSGDSLPAISCGGLPPTSLLGDSRAIVMSEPARLNLGGPKPMLSEIEEAVRAMYGAETASWIGLAGSNALKSLTLVESKDPKEYSPRAGVEYPKNDIANRLKILAQLLNMNVGLQVATVDMGGWDTHKFQGTGLDGTFAKQVEQLSEALHAFYTDMQGQKITVVVMSEFGRRLRENANKGTDHGHGGFMMVLGDHVNGGKVYGRWPGLKTDQLYERADLAVTTDYRTVLSEVIAKRGGNKKIAKVFPDFQTPQYLGIVSEV